MVVIISEIRFLSQTHQCLEQYQYLRKKFPEDIDLKKLTKVFRTLKTIYKRDKVFVVKQLNFIEKRLVLFKEERRALSIKVIELLQKLILHKKLQK